MEENIRRLLSSGIKEDVYIAIGILKSISIDKQNWQDKLAKYNYILGLGWIWEDVRGSNIIFQSDFDHIPYKSL